MSSPVVPSFDQLASARLAQWHQNGEALLTFENLRSWINVAGFVLFAPRAAQLPAPAPSVVEAVLGAPAPEATLEAATEARTLLARLVAEGIAVPLNLLGSSNSDTPDFVVAASAFAYIFTLRGDKAWKQPPAVIGAVKVSPLAAAAHEALTRHPALSAAELVTELGKEVTESAVLRALNELWSHLRVIPVPQSGGQPTLWELTSARFTKHIKAGANAGQPSALSALISLYLSTALLATEEEIETFLSPLAARSRIRDVIHALTAARELETLVLGGKTHLHISGALPRFVTPADEDLAIDVHAKPVEQIEVEGAAPNLQETGAPRIKKFVAKPRKLGTGFPSDYGRKFSGAPLAPGDLPAKATRARAARGESAPRPEGERRPFTRTTKPSGEKPAFKKPAFDKPWDENKPARRPRPAGDSEPGSEPRPRRTFTRPDGGTKPAFSRKPFGNRDSGSDRPKFGARSSSNSGDKPRVFRDRGEEGTAPPRRPFTPRPERAEGESRPPRKTFSQSRNQSGTFGRKREGGFESRPPRRDFTAGSSDRPARPSRSFDSGDRPSRPARSFDSSDRPARPTYRKFDAPRDRPSGPRPAGARPSRPFSKPRFEDGGSDRPARKPLSGDSKPFAKKSAGGFSKKSTGPRTPGSFSARPKKSVNTFTKFEGGKNPFRKPGTPNGKAKSFKGKPNLKPRRSSE